MTKRFTIALVALALFVLVAVMPVSASYYNTTPIINQGATVFIGEQGLNLTTAIHYAEGTPVADAPVNTSIGWWASAATITSSAPTKSIDLASRYTSMTVAPSDFVGYAGNWYLLNGSSVIIAPGRTAPLAVIVAADPTLDVKIWDFSQSTDMTGKSVPQGELLGFRIETNMYAALDGRYRTPLYGNRVAQTTSDSSNIVTSDGYIDIKVKDESGTTYTSLFYDELGTGNVAELTRQNVSAQPWTWGDAANPTNTHPWATKAVVNGQYAYPVGTYTVYLESKLNNMKDNYKNAGADYSGKTVSPTQTVQLVSDTVKVEANKDTVVRSKPFSITITGKPNTLYHVWVKGTSSMKGGYDDQPPMVGPNQDGVKIDASTIGYTGIGAYTQNLGINSSGYSYQNAGSTSIRVWDDIAHNTENTVTAGFTAIGNGTSLNANVTTSVSGTRTVEFLTTNWTKAQKYTIRVEMIDAAGQYKSDEVDIKVEKGAVTIVAAGDGVYYIGEEIKLSGTNTETYKTYLFITGPNLPEQGGSIKWANPRDPAKKVVSNDPTNFQVVDVLGDNTWSWKWGTANYALDQGAYTIYAVSQAKQKDDLGQAAYNTVSINIKKPFVSATASQSTVAKGDKVFITGTAMGQPAKGVMIWVLGKNYPNSIDQVKTESVNTDGSFKYELTRETTRDMYEGQYFVVVQHPMQNMEFDVYATTAGNNVVVYNRQLGTSPGTKVFTLLGAGSLQGSDAAEALVQGINDPNVDDTYTKLQFIVETPKITITPVSDKHVGDKFTITATTNLAVDDDVTVTVVSSSFKPTQKTVSGEFSGVGQSIKVKKGDSGLNTLSVDVDASAYKPDEYLVTMSGVLVTVSDSSLFQVLEGTTTIAVPTTTGTPVVTVTTVATTIPTTVPTTVPTTKSPGYGALIALIGLGAVAFIVVRRH